MQLERKHFGLVAKPVLAGWLILLLLCSATLAVSSSHHRSHHADDAADDAACVFCLFAHGKVMAAEAVAAPAGWAAAFIGSLPSAGTPAFSPVDYRLSPSRAPPFLFSA